MTKFLPSAVVCAFLMLSCAANRPDHATPGHARVLTIPVDAVGDANQPSTVEQFSPPHADLGIRLPPEFLDRLSSGLRIDVVVEVEVTTAAGGRTREPVGRCSVTLDLRDNIYRLRVREQARAALTVDSLARQCTDRDAYERATASALPGTPTVVSMREGDAANWPRHRGP